LKAMKNLFNWIWCYVWDTLAEKGA